ncbi:MAG: cobalamin biosynthesis protein CobW [Oscillospiraceae bacterium]|nr:cobalamin biosynthesis protein CobW [Oscillospiraceae bacterium]
MKERFFTTEFYLITGFLGAGKTTFLKNLLQLFRHRRMYLIVNEFGKEGVDGTLLQEMGAMMDEITNGSIFCTCRLDKFAESLQTALMAKPEVILAEASGLADPTNVRRVLADFPSVDYKGSICLADAVNLHKIYPAAVVCQKQLAVSSLVLLNKTDLATADETRAATALIAQANPAAAIKPTRFAAMQAQWLSLVVPCPDMAQAAIASDITLQKACIAVQPTMTKASLQKCLVQLSESTYRMKGFVQLLEGRFFVDCTGADVRLTPWQGEANGHIVLLAGKGMPLRKAIQSALAWYAPLLSLDA